MKGWKQVFKQMERKKKTGVATLISDKIDYNTGAIRETQMVTSSYSKEQSTKT